MDDVRPLALRLADGQSPGIAVARERIREALAVEQRAEAYWLPSLELGPKWTRHDGGKKGSGVDQT